MNKFDKIDRDFTMYSAAYTNNFKLSPTIKYNDYYLFKMNLIDLSVLVENMYDTYGKKLFKEYYKVIKSTFIKSQIGFKYNSDEVLEWYKNQNVENDFYIKNSICSASIILLMKYTIKDKSLFSSSKGLKNLVMYGTLFRINNDFSKLSFSTEEQHYLDFENYGNEIL